jgi:alkanesulfonate monooxygenase SsuD/methylene tetrahydromethanopterin reductase-like flavin-dependent oxidoreductase (luciferase family)
LAGPTYGKNPPANELDFGLIFGQHNRPWNVILETTQWADEAGLDSVWLFDHFMSLWDKQPLGPCLEGWTLLAGLATVTKNVQLGLLVVGITHRYPAVMFKEAVTVDHLSGGRAILGVGAAWNEPEHAAFGIPFPPPAERVGLFGESMEAFRLLETQEWTTYQGEFLQIENIPFEPKPVHGHIPVLVGSTGKKMMRYIAQYADQWDGGSTPEEYREVGERLNAICREIGRDPGEIRWTTGVDEKLNSDPAAFKTYVQEMAAVGVRSFRLSVPWTGPDDALRNIVTNVVPELKQQFRNQ